MKRYPNIQKGNNTMKTKIRNLFHIALVCIVLLGILPSLSFADNEDLLTFHKMTDLSELQAGYHYIIVYGTLTDGSYPALSTDANNYTGVTMTEEVRTSGTGLTLSKDASCIMTLSLSSGGDWNFTSTDGSRLKLNSGVLFDTSPGAIKIEDNGSEDGTWKVYNNRNLRWNGSGFESPTSGSAAATPVEIWTDYVLKQYIQITSMDQLMDLTDGTPFVMVIVDKDGNRHALGREASNKWLLDVERKDGAEGNYKYKYIQPTGSSYFVFNDSGSCTFSTNNAGEYLKFEYLALNESYQLYLPGPGEAASVDITSAPFRAGGLDDDKIPRNNEVFIQYAEGATDQFYLRGNGSNRWLLYSGNDAGNDYASGTIDGDRVLVEFYADFQDAGDNEIQFLDTDGNLQFRTYADSSVTLIRKLPNIKKNGTEYTFAGWSAEKSYSHTADGAFLSRDDSTNLFGYQLSEDKLSGKNCFLQKAKNLGLLGDGDREAPSTIELSSIPGYKGGTLVLYPVYAELGFDGVVTADVNNIPVVGVSDWKSDQAGKHRYQDPEREWWLGSVDVEIYKDGVIWTSDTLYFSYHNDNSADLNFKFVWQDLVEKYGGLYDFVSRYDEIDFPLYDPVGNFVFDGVCATQGGGQGDEESGSGGLYYHLNWMTDHGGQLDNVMGGSVVKLYVTTKYNVLYYLDGKLITDPAWTDGKYYTTPGTEKAFGAERDKATYKVTKDNEYYLLMEHNDLEEKFVLERGEFATFSYDFHNSYHTISLKDSPASLVPQGSALVSTAWSLKDKDGNELATLSWKDEYTITGTEYGTGNTANSYKEDIVLDAFEADSPYTFHLHAYTNPGTGDTSNLNLWVILLSASLLTLIVTFLMKKAGLKSSKCRK